MSRRATDLQRSGMRAMARKLTHDHEKRIGMTLSQYREYSKTCRICGKTSMYAFGVTGWCKDHKAEAIEAMKGNRK